MSSVSSLKVTSYIISSSFFPFFFFGYEIGCTVCVIVGKKKKKIKSMLGKAINGEEKK